MIAHVSFALSNVAGRDSFQSVVGRASLEQMRKQIVTLVFKECSREQVSLIVETFYGPHGAFHMSFKPPFEIAERRRELRLV